MTYKKLKSVNQTSRWWNDGTLYKY